MSAADRSTPPPAGRPRDFAFPAFERERLPCGLELLLAPRHDVPLVEIQLQLPAGADRNPQMRPGLATLTASLVDEGTDRRSGTDIAIAVERLGGSLATGADWNQASLEATLLAADLATGLELTFEVARRPTFPPEEFERLRRQAEAELLRRRDQPAVLAEEALSAALFPGTPYAHLLLGTESTIRDLTREQVRQFHGERYRPDGASLLVVGDFDPQAARRMVDEALAGWRSDPPPASPPLEVEMPTVRRVILVDRPAAAQTELRVAHPGVPRVHPDRTRLGLLNALLGGKFTSRLNLNLRERHGFTYGATSRFVDRRGRGPFTVGAAVANGVAGAAVREILFELERLRQEPVDAAELAESKTYIRGVFPYTLQTVSSVLARMAELTLWGLPDDHFQRALESVEATSADDLLALARRHLHPDRATIIAVGPAGELAPQLAGYGEVEVRRLDSLRADPVQEAP
ncbi:MAG: insulinase family protein [Thermoanaerobaculia bacterium]|nr:MAG: insulinase family protein [Thermoanaerobaculia bacterium]MBZ0102786.1 insulinase family protein [Thermoanaerobaculia bacterium]